jgi:hypothetical protein
MALARNMQQNLPSSSWKLCTNNINTIMQITSEPCEQELSKKFVYMPFAFIPYMKMKPKGTIKYKQYLEKNLPYNCCDYN